MRMTQCEYCKTFLWGRDQTSCSGGQCSSAYEMAMEDGTVLVDEDDNEIDTGGYEDE